MCDVTHVQCYGAFGGQGTGIVLRRVVSCRVQNAAGAGVTKILRPPKKIAPLLKIHRRGAKFLRKNFALAKISLSPSRKNVSPIKNIAPRKINSALTKYVYKFYWNS
jgi:hypothetical protein